MNSPLTANTDQDTIGVRDLNTGREIKVAGSNKCAEDSGLQNTPGISDRNLGNPRRRGNVREGLLQENNPPCWHEEILSKLIISPYQQVF